MTIKEKLLAASAYLFGIPALYIVLTDNRSKKYVGYHGSQAFFLWLIYFVVFFALRFLINWVWSKHYIAWFDKFEIAALLIMAGYAVFCGYRCLLGQNFKIPH